MGGEPEFISAQLRNTEENTDTAIIRIRLFWNFGISKLFNLFQTLIVSGIISDALGCFASKTACNFFLNVLLCFSSCMDYTSVRLE